MAVDIAAMLRKFVGRCLRGNSCVLCVAAMAVSPVMTVRLLVFMGGWSKPH